MPVVNRWFEFYPRYIIRASGIEVAGDSHFEYNSGIFIKCWKSMKISMTGEKWAYPRPDLRYANPLSTSSSRRGTLLCHPLLWCPAGIRPCCLPMPVWFNSKMFFFRLLSAVSVYLALILRRVVSQPIHGEISVNFLGFLLCAHTHTHTHTHTYTHTDIYRNDSI